MYIHIASLKKIIDDTSVETAFNIPAGYRKKHDDNYTTLLSRYSIDENHELFFTGDGAYILDSSAMTINKRYYANISYIAE